MGKTKKKKERIKMWIIIPIIIGGIAIVLAGGYFISAPGRREVANLVIDDVNFKKFRDGVYVGEYIGENSHLRDAQVEVTISDGTISNIKTLKGAIDKDGNPVKLTGNLSVDSIYENVMKSQTLEVDVVSGATLTSKAHLKALENALKKAQPEQ